jgi:hypothetical protein
MTRYRQTAHLGLSRDGSYWIRWTVLTLTQGMTWYRLDT